jgi:hypothetical protein
MKPRFRMPRRIESIKNRTRRSSRRYLYADSILASFKAIKED